MVRLWQDLHQGWLAVTDNENIMRKVSVSFAIARNGNLPTGRLCVQRNDGGIIDIAARLIMRQNCALMGLPPMTTDDYSKSNIGDVQSVTKENT